jgi:hypothetical protein
MFENANVGGDTMAETLGQLFRLPPNGRPMTIMQLAGFPSDVVDAVVSVLCRMAFDFGLWSDGAVPLLFVCEEAHRYAAADRTLGFGPTRKAIARIAKEGRKYGGEEATRMGPIYRNGSCGAQGRHGHTSILRWPRSGAAAPAHRLNGHSHAPALSTAPSGTSPVVT